MCSGCGCEMLLAHRLGSEFVRSGLSGERLDMCNAKAVASARKQYEERRKEKAG